MVSNAAHSLWPDTRRFARWVQSIVIVVALTRCGDAGQSAGPDTSTGGTNPPPPPPPVSEISRILDSVRVARNLPAIGGAIVTRTGVTTLGVVGVRRAGGAVAVTVDDKFHLGSMLKSMTSGLM